MQIQRLTVPRSTLPFPIYADPTEELLRAHRSNTRDRDPAVAHILGVLSGYSYADLATVSMMASRLGFGESVCIRVAQTVDAMMIFCTAYVLQSRCGRVGILCYRGTEPGNLGNWIGDADVGSQSIELGGQRLSVHSGFYRNVRATRSPILELMHAAVRGESLADTTARVDEPLEALYITGHSLGGAMAVLFALGLTGHDEHRALLDRLRAVYTFGQPLAVAGPLPEIAGPVEGKVYRHLYRRDIVPAIPPRVWGTLEHFGNEFHYTDGEWRRRDTVTAQLAHIRDVSKALLAQFASVSKRDAKRYTMSDHGPHHYIAALRPAGRVTEFGDLG